MMEDPYIVEVGNNVQRGDTDPDKFVSLGVIEQGVVSPNETVNVLWDGTIDGCTTSRRGPIHISVTVDDDQARVL